VRKPDWEAVKRDFQSGQFSIRELEARHGVSKSTIDRRRRKEAWQKDLTGEINTIRRGRIAALDASEYEAGQGVGQHPGHCPTVPLPTAEAAAERQVDVIVSHRGLAKRLRAQADRQLDLVDKWLSGNETDQAEAARRLFHRRGDSLAAHLSSAAAIVERVIKLERALYGLEQAVGGDGSIETAHRLQDEIQRRLASSAK